MEAKVRMFLAGYASGEVKESPDYTFHHTVAVMVLCFPKLLMVR